MLTPGWRFPGSSKGFVKELLASPRMPLFTSTIVPCASEVPGSGGCYLGVSAVFPAWGGFILMLLGFLPACTFGRGLSGGHPGGWRTSLCPLAEGVEGAESCASGDCGSAQPSLTPTTAILGG